MSGFFHSEAFGSLLKGVTAVAAFGFGAFGVGAETRNPNKTLNRNGWIALIGMGVAGILAISTAGYDYFHEKAKTQLEAAKDLEIKGLNHQLLVNGQRALYPLRGVTVDAVLILDKSAGIVAQFLKRLDAAIAKDPECARPDPFECVAMGSNGEVYKISETSTLYPKVGTPLRAGLDNLALNVDLIKQKPGVGAAASTFNAVGRFVIRFGDGRSGEKSIRYAVGNDHLALMIEGYEVKDSVLLQSKVASLVDFMPGALAIEADVDTDPFFHALASVNFGIPATIKIYTPLRKAVSVNRAKISFPYPITISVGKPYTVRCVAPGEIEEEFLARLLPLDPDAKQNDSGLGVPALTMPEPEQQHLCASLVSADNKPIKDMTAKKPDAIFTQ